MVGIGWGEEGLGVGEDDEFEGLGLEEEVDELEGLEEEDIWKEKGEVVKVDMKFWMV